MNPTNKIRSICQQCGQPFTAEAREFRNGRRFCGHKCGGVSVRAKLTKPRPACRVCGQPVKQPDAVVCGLTCRHRLRGMLGRTNQDRKAFYRATLADTYVRKLLLASNPRARITPARLAAKRNELAAQRRRAAR